MSVLALYLLINAVLSPTYAQNEEYMCRFIGSDELKDHLQHCYTFESSDQFREYVEECINQEDYSTLSFADFIENYCEDDDVRQSVNKCMRDQLSEVEDQAEEIIGNFGKCLRDASGENSYDYDQYEDSEEARVNERHNKIQFAIHVN